MNSIIEQSRATVSRLASADKNSLGASWLDECMLAKQLDAEVMTRLTRDKSGAIVSSCPGLDLAANTIPIIVHDLPSLHALIGDGPATDGRVVVVSSQFVRNNRRATEEGNVAEPWVAKALLCAAQRALGLPGSPGASVVDTEVLAAAMPTKATEIIGFDRPASPALFAYAAQVGRAWREVPADLDEDGAAQAWRNVLAIAQELPGQAPSTNHFAYPRLSLLTFASTQLSQPVTGQLERVSELMVDITSSVSPVMGADVLVTLVGTPLLEYEAGEKSLTKKGSLIQKAMILAGESVTDLFRSSWISGMSNIADLEGNTFFRNQIDAFKPFYGHPERTIAACLTVDAVNSDLLEVAVAEKLISSSPEDEAAQFIVACHENGKSKKQEVDSFVARLRYHGFPRHQYPDQVSLDRCFAYRALNVMETGEFQKTWQRIMSGSESDATQQLITSLQRITDDYEGAPSPLMRKALFEISQAYPQLQEWFANTMGPAPAKSPRLG